MPNIPEDLCRKKDQAPVTKITMARGKKAGVGALGKAKARFFHPSKPIRDKLQSQYGKAEIDNVLVVGKNTHRINHKEQKAYECRINDFDEANIFKIVCSNFKVTQEGPTPFPDEAAPADVAPTAPRDLNADIRGSRENAQPSVRRNYNSESTRSEDIAQLRSEGVEVDDEDVAPENIAPPSADTGRWEKPRTCPRRSDVNVSNTEGRWKDKSWSTIKEMDLLSVFRMCMPEEFIKTVIIPETNKHLEGDRLTFS